MDTDEMRAALERAHDGAQAALEAWAELLPEMEAGGRPRTADAVRQAIAQQQGQVAFSAHLLGYPNPAGNV